MIERDKWAENNYKAQVLKYEPKSRTYKLKIDLGRMQYHVIYMPVVGLEGENRVGEEIFIRTYVTDLKEYYARVFVNKPRLYHYRFDIHRIYDADTFMGFLHEGFGREFDKSCRIFGIDAPEVNRIDQRPAGYNARQFLVNHIFQGKPEIYPHTVTVNTVKRDKYSGRVIIWDDDFPLQIIKKGLAVPYEGETKAVWTKEMLDYAEGVVL